MKGDMMILALLCLFLCWMLPVDSITIRFNFSELDAKLIIPLSMAEDSVDDMYFGCTDTMMKTIKDKYFEEEKKTFEEEWKNATKCAKNKEKEKDKEDVALTEDHMQAICLYTSEDIHKRFHVAVKTQRCLYRSSFQFHSLHFLLTSAIQILNSNYSCQTAYRRSRDMFTGEVNQTIRFGQFASSSKLTNLTRFGSETCFKIETCFGAFLKNYSLYTVEEEVLIPPYEMFKITEKIDERDQIKKDIPQGLDDCDVVYVLESAGCMSNLNCKAAYP